MKIAIAADSNGRVSQHFGHCSEFVLVDVDNNQVTGRKPVANPGHQPGVLPPFLKDLGVEIIISGGMGGSAINLFNGLGINVVTGAAGNVDDVIEQYKQGKLSSSGEACSEHEHKDECHTN